MSDLVIDCSIAMSWHFEDETVPYAESVLQQLSRLTTVVPAFFFLETLNVLVVGERRQRTTAQRADLFFEDLQSLRIVVEPALSPEPLLQVRTVARTHQLSAYHAMYLELALRRRLPLATLDKPLRAAAQREGVALFESPS